MFEGPVLFVFLCFVLGSMAFARSWGKGRKCRFCAEYMQHDAILCPRCGRKVTTRG